MNTAELLQHPRLLLEAALQPVAGTRFQPTGFPDLGAATYTAADGASMLLVESAQSMANRLETVCWDESAVRPVDALAGLPYVESSLPGGQKTNSLLEAHRLNSPYLVRDEYTGDITAYFNLDLSLIAGFQIPPPARELLVALAIFKIRRFLESGLRLRTACDLELRNGEDGLKVKRPAGFILPTLAAATARIQELLEDAENTRLFADPRVTAVNYAKGTAKKAGKGKGKKADPAESDDAEGTDNE